VALLYGIVFLTGACVLVLETLGSALLAPVFGTSVTVWSALITTTLAALAAGAAFGGGIADDRGARLRLPGILALGAVWLLVVPAVRGAFLPAVSALGLKLGALVGAVLLLFAPLAALGAATPFIVRAASRSPGEAGRHYGLLSAAGTAGGVAGALGAGFWLLPYFSVAAVANGTAFAMFAAAGLARSAERR
jgi:hypothetical protein